MDDLGACLDRLDSTCVIVTTAEGVKPYGCLVTFIAPASIEPRRLVVMTSYENLTHEVIERTQKLAINLIPLGEREWLSHWGYQSGRDVDKFADIRWHPGENGCPVLDEAAGHIEGKVIATIDGGDHAIRVITPTAAGLERPEVPILSMIYALARGWEEPNVLPPPTR